MKAARVAAVASAAIAMMTTSHAQAPGDRPAPNPRATRSVVMGRNGMVATSQPLALAAAIAYARNGYAVSEIISEQWKGSERKLADDRAAAATFLPNGRAPRPGEVFVNPKLAATLEQIAAGGRDAFYKGAIAAAIVADLKKRDGLLDARDFAEHRSDWVEPISTTYRGFDVYELPPNTQGFVVLEMLNILEGYDLKSMGPG